MIDTFGSGILSKGLLMSEGEESYDADYKVGGPQDSIQLILQYSPRFAQRAGPAHSPMLVSPSLLLVALEFIQL